MSLERKLLGKWHNGDLLPEEYMRLMKETKQLLAQPEQEPVAWKVIDGTHGGYMFSRVKPTEHTYKYNVVIPLYTAPPKREPLSEEESYHEAKRLYEAEDGLWYQDGFVDGLKFAEKMHGIGGE